MNEVIITDIDNQGRGIGRLNNKVIFIENAYLDEVVKVKIKKETNNYLEGEVIEYVKKSPLRIKEACKYNCGGCHLQHLSYENQLQFKENNIQKIIDKFTNLNITVNKIIPSNNIYNYRNKITLHVDGKIGLYKAKTNSIIEIDNCLLVNQKINSIIKELKELKFNHKDEIIIREANNETMVSLNHYVKGIEELDADTILCNNKVIKGKGYIKEKINQYEFIISNQSFFQVNKNQTINLYEKVLEYAELTGNENVLDLYCGTGTIGIYLSKKAKKVLGVEINKDAIKDANKNKEINKINNIEFICGDAKKVIKENNFKTDILILDPPRSGLFKGMIEDINKINPKKIIYVSCNPITLARDLEQLRETYNINQIQPIDMFPNTYHCESVTVLERK